MHEKGIGEQCSETEENLRKNNSKRTYQQVKDLTTVKQGKATTEDDHPILCKEVEDALQSLKKGKSDGVDNIPAELVQAGGEDVITALRQSAKRFGR